MRSTSGLKRIGPDIVSWLVSAAVFALAALFGVYELRGRLYTSELIARNDAERTLNLLLSASRAARTAGGGFFPPMPRPGEGPDPAEEARNLVAAIETHPELRDRVLGVAAYGADRGALFRYGSAPERISARGERKRQEGIPPRAYRYDRKTRTLLVQHPFPVFRPRPEAAPYRSSPILYYELRENALFARNAVAAAVFIAWLAASAAAILIVRRTLRKNAVYREELRRQRELVALGTAARTLAHEIKNPLSAIALQADVVGRLCPGAADRELAGIAQETARIRLLVDRIGDFLREPKGRPERLDLAEFAAGILSRAGAGGAAVPVSADRPGIAVSADAARLRSVIENLARNALDSGGPPEAVEVRVREEGAAAVLEVLDRGPGFPEGIQPENFFDPFFTTKTSGSGLGLALSRRFVEAAGGRIAIGPRDGGGAAVRVSLPKA